MFNGLTSVSRKSCVSCANIDANDVNSEKLKHLIREYFQSDESQAEFELEQSQPVNTLFCTYLSEIFSNIQISTTFLRLTTLRPIETSSLIFER